MSQRAERMALQIRRELAELILREIKDPRVQEAGLLTVTHVYVSDDFSFARVLISVLNSPAAPVVKSLNKAAGFLRGVLGRRLCVRRIPELNFIVDDTEEKASHIEDLLREVGAAEAGIAAEKLAQEANLPESNPQGQNEAEK